MLVLKDSKHVAVLYSYVCNFFAIILPGHFGFSIGFDSGYFLVAIVSILLALGLWRLQQYKTFSFLSSLSK